MDPVLAFAAGVSICVSGYVIYKAIIPCFFTVIYFCVLIASAER